MEQELLKKRKQLKQDLSWIGFADEDNGKYYCTPVGAKIIGWDNGIHYCFVEGFGETVFAVNPENYCGREVYPVAKNLYDFFSLILATKNTNVIHQVISWDKRDYDEFMASPDTVEYNAKREVTEALEAIRTELGVSEMQNPFEYIKEIQKDFPYSKIKFSDEYYEVSGIEKP